MSARACGSALARRSSLRVPGALTLALATWHGGRAAWIEAKAHLAQALVRHAWRETLAGASGRTMAFGPGHLDGTPLPREPGNAVISGHRDTHFAFLRKLGRGDEIVVEAPDGRQHRYRVATTRIVDRHDVWIVADAGDTRLTLVTCYPFDAIRPGGPLRYVVVARSVDS